MPGQAVCHTMARPAPACGRACRLTLAPASRVPMARVTRVADGYEPPRLGSSSLYTTLNSMGKPPAQGRAWLWILGGAVGMGVLGGALWGVSVLLAIDATSAGTLVASAADAAVPDCPVSLSGSNFLFGGVMTSTCRGISGACQRSAKWWVSAGRWRRRGGWVEIELRRAVRRGAAPRPPCAQQAPSSDAARSLRQTHDRPCARSCAERCAAGRCPTCDPRPTTGVRPTEPAGNHHASPTSLLHPTPPHPGPMSAATTPARRASQSAPATRPR